MRLDRCALQEPKPDPDRFNSHLQLYLTFLTHVSARRAKAAAVDTRRGVLFCEPKFSGKWRDTGATAIKLLVAKSVALGVFWPAPINLIWPGFIPVQTPFVGHCLAIPSQCILAVCFWALIFAVASGFPLAQAPAHPKPTSVPTACPKRAQDLR